MSASGRKVDFVPGAFRRKNGTLVTSGGGHDDVGLGVERWIVKLKNADDLASTSPYLTEAQLFIQHNTRMLRTGLLTFLEQCLYV